jgi:hypothetical protein
LAHSQAAFFRLVCRQKSYGNFDQFIFRQLLGKFSGKIKSACGNRSRLPQARFLPLCIKVSALSCGQSAT